MEKYNRLQLQKHHVKYAYSAENVARLYLQLNLIAVMTISEYDNVTSNCGLRPINRFVFLHEAPLRSKLVQFISTITRYSYELRPANIQVRHFTSSLRRQYVTVIAYYLTCNYYRPTTTLYVVITLMFTDRILSHIFL